MVDQVLVVGRSQMGAGGTKAVATKDGSLNRPVSCTPRVLWLFGYRNRKRGCEPTLSFFVAEIRTVNSRVVLTIQKIWPSSVAK